MTRWAEAIDRPTLIVGDFNIAPLECDVYNHKALLKVVSHTPIEVETLGKLTDAHGWVDLGRKHIPAPERNYSWWSYRSYWREKDQGRRLDHMWASPSLAAQSLSHRMVEETRRWDQPSDHIPLITEFDL
jgi:exodeoxyribonuclease-3